MEEYNKKAELNLIEMKKQKEISDKRLLHIAIIMGIFAIIFLSCFNLLLGFIKVEIWLRIFLEVSGIIIYFSLILIIVRVEQVTGYYECGKCHHKYIPTYKQMVFSMYMGKARYIKCPHCGKKSLNKKVLSK